MTNVLIVWCLYSRTVRLKERGKLSMEMVLVGFILTSREGAEEVLVTSATGIVTTVVELEGRRLNNHLSEETKELCKVELEKQEIQKSQSQINNEVISASC